MHAAGREARAAVDNARDKLAALLHVKPHEIFSPAAGQNRAIWPCSVWRVAGCIRGGHVISAKTEHHAVLNTVEHLEKHEDFEVTWLNVSSDGIVDLNQLAESIRPETRLVSIMAANNETGVIQPMREISQICRERGVLLHSDMVQSFGKMEIDLSLVDAASFAAHKFYGPKGAGFLFLRSGLSIQPIMFGGAHENERRPGTENVAAIAGMAAAAEWTLRDREQEQQREAKLRDELWTRISQKCSRGKAERRERATAGKHIEREFARTRFGDASHRARFGRRVRVERFGLHGGLSGRRRTFCWRWVCQSRERARRFASR